MFKVRGRENVKVNELRFRYEGAKHERFMGRVQVGLYLTWMGIDAYILYRFVESNNIGLEFLVCSGVGLLAVYLLLVSVNDLKRAMQRVTLLHAELHSVDGKAVGFKSSKQAKGIKQAKVIKFSNYNRTNKIKKG